MTSMSVIMIVYKRERWIEVETVKRKRNSSAWIYLQKKNGANAHPTTPAAADDDDDDVLYLSLTVLTIKLTREYVYTYR